MFELCTIYTLFGLCTAFTGFPPHFRTDAVVEGCAVRRTAGRCLTPPITNPTNSPRAAMEEKNEKEPPPLTVDPKWYAGTLYTPWTTRSTENIAYRMLSERFYFP